MRARVKRVRVCPGDLRVFTMLFDDFTQDYCQGRRNIDCVDQENVMAVRNNANVDLRWAKEEHTLFFRRLIYAKQQSKSLRISKF